VRQVQAHRVVIRGPPGVLADKGEQVLHVRRAGDHCTSPPWSGFCSLPLRANSLPALACTCRGAVSAFFGVLMSFAVLAGQGLNLGRYALTICWFEQTVTP